MGFLDLDDEPAVAQSPSVNGRGHGPQDGAEAVSEVATSVGGPADDDDFVELSSILEEADDDVVAAPAAGGPVGASARSGAEPAASPGPQEPSFAEAESEFPDDSEFFAEARDGGRPDPGGDFVDPFASNDDGAEENLIDLDSMGAFIRYEPAGGGSPDTSSLTLHPMFFDQDAPDLPGLADSNRTEKDPDRWISSGEG
jgi:hypothetical protein